MLAVPALVPMAHAYIAPLAKGMVPTGFIQYDMPYYMANARECFDRGFHLLYGNPYAGYETPRIYFQPQIVLLGCLERLGLEPGLALNLFGLAALVFTTCVAIYFYREVVGLENAAKRIGLVCFFWGGGVLTLAGVARGLATDHLDRSQIWRFDASSGWWMFNFGRNLVYPTEAYYHGIFLLCMLFVIRKNTAGALACSTVESMSHPFHGLTLSLVLVAYSICELALRSKAVRAAMLVGAVLIAAAHLWYYMIFLNRFSDHRSLMDQWRLGWIYRPANFLPALFIVGTLAALRAWRWPGLRKILDDSRNRLFLVWFLVVFALTQHYLFMKPIQPIHFAHGFDWMALFFLSAPLLVAILERLLSIRSPAARQLALGTVLLFVLLDNTVWFGSFLFPGEDPPQAIMLTRSEQGALKWLDQHAVPGAMVVSEDGLVGYLVSTYTPIRSWAGHDYNTPGANQRAEEVMEAFQRGRILPEWKKIPVYYVSVRSEIWHPPASVTEVYENEQLTIFGPGTTRGTASSQ